MGACRMILQYLQSLYSIFHYTTSKTTDEVEGEPIGIGAIVDYSLGYTREELDEAVSELESVINNEIFIHKDNKKVSNTPK